MKEITIMESVLELSSIVLTASIGLMAFLLGVLVGVLSKNRVRYRLRLRQNRGEAYVRKTIVSFFKPPNFHLLNNITLSIQGETTQIDHILVSTKGVFVIETKNYSGWLFGNEKDAQWTQVIYRVKNRFQNPIRQNYGHVIAVEQALDFLPKEQIHSIVVFAGSAEFKTSIPKGVIYLGQLPTYLKAFQDDVISVNRLEYCVGRIECRRYEVTGQTDIEHIARLQEKFS